MFTWNVGLASHFSLFWNVGVIAPDFKKMEALKVNKFCRAYRTGTQAAQALVCLLKRDKTTRSLFTRQDSDIHVYLNIRIYTSRFVCLLFKSEISVRTSSFIYTSRFVSVKIYQTFQMYRNIEICMCTLTFVHIH